MNIIKQNWIGLVGLISLCIAIPLHAGTAQNVLNILGIVVLILYAKIGKNEFFLYLEFVILLGTILKIFNASNIVLIAALVVATILSLIKVFRNPSYREWNAIFGVIGLVGLVYGYSTLNNWGYAVGGVSSAIYSFIAFRNGLKSALIFAVLNLIYSGLAFYMIMR